MRRCRAAERRNGAVNILSSADLIVAHNAAFDRPFVDRRLPVIAGKHWGLLGTADLQAECHLRAFRCQGLAEISRISLECHHAPLMEDSQRRRPRIEHRLTRAYPLGQTAKPNVWCDPSRKRPSKPSIAELRRHVPDCPIAYNFVNQLKELKFKTPARQSRIFGNQSQTFCHQAESSHVGTKHLGHRLDE